jgi:predicted negative regulator of RcsB-dependent stress response
MSTFFYLIATMTKQHNQSTKLPEDLNLNKPDRFQQFMFHMADRIYRQRQRYFAGGLIIVAIGSGAWYWQEQQRLQMDAEADLFYASQQAATKAALQKKPEKEVQALAHYLGQASTASMKVVSQLQVAEAHSRLENWGKAEKLLNEVILGQDVPDFSRNMARLNLSAVMEAQDKWDDAHKYLLQLDNARWDDLRLRNLARISLSQNKKEDATEYLSKLSEMQDSPFKQEAEDLLRQIR